MTDVMLEIVEPSAEIITPREEIKDFAKRVELAGRCAYKSEDKITDDSSKAFISKIIRSGHTSVIEHCSITARIIGDRSMSHQLVRHRIGMSYTQESQRFCNYGKNDALKVVLPPSVVDDVNVEEILHV